MVSSRQFYLDPSYIAAVIAERLPNPINDEQQWLLGEEELESNKESFLEKTSKLFKKSKTRSEYE